MDRECIFLLAPVVVDIVGHGCGTFKLSFACGIDHEHLCCDAYQTELPGQGKEKGFDDRPKMIDICLLKKYSIAIELMIIVIRFATCYNFTHLSFKLIVDGVIIGESVDSQSKMHIPIRI